MLETKTSTSATSSPSIRSTASITLSWTFSATSRSTASAPAVTNSSRWIFRSVSSTTLTPRWAVSRFRKSPKWRAFASSSPATPSISRAAMAAMLAITSLATRTVPAGAFCSITIVILTIGSLVGRRQRGQGVWPKRWRIRSGSLHVVASARVDADAVALVDEQGHLDGGARLQGRRLCHAGHGVTAHALFGLLDLEFDSDRQLDANHLGLVAEQVDRVALLQEGQHVADL